MEITDDSYTINPASGCWEWTGLKDKDGYGRFEEDGSWVGAHRRSWETLNGPIPDGLELDHRCETPACINPAHLRLMTHGENIRRSRQAKLTWRKVHAIRASDEAASALAERYGVSQHTIYEVRANNVWPEGDGKSRSRTKQLNIRFPPALTDEIRAAAKERDVTLAEALRQGARMWLGQQEPPVEVVQAEMNALREQRRDHATEQLESRPLISASKLRKFG